MCACVRESERESVRVCEKVRESVCVCERDGLNVESEAQRSCFLPQYFLVHTNVETSLEELKESFMKIKTNFCKERLQI